MSGLECSEITVNELDKLQLRFDAEFYRKHYLKVAAMIDGLPHTTIENLKIAIDCSAFYPSVVDIYSFEGEGIPFIRVNEITNLGLVSVTGTTAFLPEDFLNNNLSTMARCKPGDIVIAKGGNTLAKTGILNDNFSEYATCRDIVILRTDSLSLPMKYYVWAYLQSGYGQNALWQTASQTGQPHLTLDYIKALKVPLFSNAFYDAIQYCYQESQAVNENANAKYKEAETLLLSALALDTFAPSQENTSVKNFSEITASGRLDAEYYQKKYDEIESKVKSCPHGYVFVIDFFNLVKDGFDKQKDCYPYIEIGDINISEATAVYNVIPTEELPANAKIKVQTGDILVSKVRPNRGAVAIVPAIPDLIVSGAFCVLRSKGLYSSEVLLILLKCSIYRDWLLKWNVGTSYPVIKDDDVCNLPLPLLPDEIQKQIAEKVRCSFALREESKALLKAATRAVEIAIEEDEAAAMEFLREKTMQENV